MTVTKNLPEFVQDLLRTGPPMAGQGVHQWLFTVARVLHPYRDPNTIKELLRAMTVRCGRRVTEREIEDAVRNSKEVAWNGKQDNTAANPSAWPKVNQEQREAIIDEGVMLVDLWEASPVRFEDNESHTEEIIDMLFPGDPLLCCGKSSMKFATRPRSTWRGKMAELQCIVPSPMTAIKGLTQDGKESEHTLQNTGPRRFLVIEQDQGSLDEQAAILAHLAGKAPLALVAHSGSKSLHGWFYCSGVKEEVLRKFMRCAVVLGADRATWTRPQFVRMPDGRRDNGNRQAVYFFNPEMIK